MSNASRIVALGGSICRILRGLEAPGGSRFRQPIGTGWVPLNKQTLWGREPGGSEVGSLDVWMFGVRKLEVWMFASLSSLFSLGVWMFGLIGVPSHARPRWVGG